MSDPSVILSDVQLVLGSGSNKVQVLSGVDLSVERGERVAIVGPSGSGKTSLMLVIAGLEAPSAGSVTVAGEVLNGLSESKLAKFRQRQVGIVFQQFHLIPTMTALQNVAVPLEFAGDRDANARASEMLAAVGLSARLHHYPHQLSGGEQQRVAIARAVIARPALLLADEPTGNLDQATGERIMQMLFDLQRKHGMTLLLITHDPDLATRCDRTVTVQDGRVQR